MFYVKLSVLRRNICPIFMSFGGYMLIREREAVGWNATVWS